MLVGEPVKVVVQCLYAPMHELALHIVDSKSKMDSVVQNNSWLIGVFMNFSFVYSLCMSLSIY